MVWRPTLADRGGPLYQRIVDALASDVAEGRLGPGQQLPTHRALAKALDVDLSTVTHAYREARQRGLIEARVGQGTFVAESLSQPRAKDHSSVAFDLSMNIPPQPLAADLEGRIVRGLAELVRRPGLSGYLSYRQSAGLAEERETAAAWLRPRLAEAAASRLLICPGTQSVLPPLLNHLAAPGDTILTDRLTYPGMIAAAAAANIRLVGVEGDDEGMLPDALARAMKAHRPKALYLIPTIHNPTTITLTPRRRRALAALLRKTGLPLIEDDAYGLLEPDASPMANVLPELTYYAASLSKCIAPGLRISLVLAPSSPAAGKLEERLRAALQMTTPLMVGIVTRWIRNGNADDIVAAIRAEAAARQKLAGQILAGRAYDARPHGHHIWLKLPERWTSRALVANAQSRGLAIVGSDAFLVDGGAPNAVRLALGAAASRLELGSALGLLLSSLDGSSPARHIV